MLVGGLMPDTTMRTYPYQTQTHRGSALSALQLRSDVTVTASHCPVCQREALWEWCTSSGDATLLYIFRRSALTEGLWSRRLIRRLLTRGKVWIEVRICVNVRRRHFKPKTKNKTLKTDCYTVWHLWDPSDHSARKRKSFMQSFSKAKVRDMELSHSWLTRLPRGALAPIYLSHLWGGSSDGSALDLY